MQVNLRGEQLFASWNQIFSTSYWSSGRYLYAFDGKRVDNGTGAVPDWYLARGWHGSNVDGTFRAGYTCLDWSSDSATEQAVGGISTRGA